MESEHENDNLDDDLTSSTTHSLMENSSSEVYIVIASPSETDNLSEKIDESMDIENNSNLEGDIKKSLIEETDTSFLSAKCEEGVKPKISRELKELHKAAAESKIITEFTNVKEKKRSRKPLNSPNTSRSLECDKKSGDMLKTEEEVDRVIEDNKTPKSMKLKVARSPSDSKKGVNLEHLFNAKGTEVDTFCWQCHKDQVHISCKTCPRSFHQRCVRGNIVDSTDWCCPECVSIVQAETTDTRSNAMKQVSLSHLCELLKFALKRMSDYVGAEPFLSPVDKNEFPDYLKYVVHPMDLSMLEHNIKKNLYGSTEAFIADTKWILHNSVIYNSFHTKLTSVAKGIIKICKQEMNEIETCPECYLKANTNNDTNWFLEVCSHPHMLVWAKLKGYPYWPAKAMTVSSNGLVDVRFFGAHDKAWIPAKDCLLYSEKDPNFSDKGKRSDFIESLKELAIYIKNLEKKFGKFHCAPFKTSYPSDQASIYSMMLPSYKFKSNSLNSNAQIKNKIKVVTKKVTTHNTPDSKKDNKINTSTDDDSIIDGYGTEDDETQKDILNDSEDNLNDISVKHNPLRAHVRMRGGKINSTGKIKIIKILKGNPEGDSSKLLSEAKNTINKFDTKITISPDNEIKKRKSNTDSTEVKEKKIKLENHVSNIQTKDDCEVSVYSEIIQDEQLLQELNTVAHNIENVNMNNSISNQENTLTKESDNETIKSLCSVNDLPQISLTSPTKSVSVNELVSDITTNKNIKDFKLLNSKTRIMLRKRISLPENESINNKICNISNSNISDSKLMQKKALNEFDSEQIIEKNTSIKSVKNTCTSTLSKNVVSGNIKTEPLDDYEAELSLDATSNSTYESSNAKKQSARKTFVSKSKTSSSPTMNKNLTKILPNPMVYIPHSSTTIPKLKLKSSKEIVTESEEAVEASDTSTRNLYITKKIEANNIEIIEKQAGNSNLPIEVNSHSKMNSSLLSTSMKEQFPSDCGPVTKLINENASKLSNYFQKLLHETLNEFGGAGSSEAQIKKLEADIESLKWIHKQELSELKHNTELILLEIRNSFEVENAHNLVKFRKNAEAERIRCVQETKSKQWCVFCGKEAQFYCCWNTSYCDHECQRKHWNTHMTLCGQHRDVNQDDSSANVNDLKRTKSKIINRTSHQVLKGTPKLKQNLNNSTLSNNHFLANIECGQFEVLNALCNKSASNSASIFLNKNKKDIVGH